MHVQPIEPQAPGGIALMEYQYAANTLATHPTEVLFRSFKEAPGYDFRNIMQHGADYTSDHGERSSRRSSVPSFDMVQASQHLTPLNNGSFYSEYAARYDSRSTEETDNLFRPPVAEFEDDLICSRSSSLGLLRPTLDQYIKPARVTPSKVADDGHVVRHSKHEGEEVALTGLVMEKILRDHFQDASETSSHCLETPTISSTRNASPAVRDIEELEGRRLEKSTTLTSSLQIECGVTPEPSPFQHFHRLAPMASSEFTLVQPAFRRPVEAPMASSEFTLVQPAFRRPVEGTHSSEFNAQSYPKWKQQRPEPAGAHGVYLDPSPSFCETSSGSGFKSRIRSRMETDGMEQASSYRPKRKRTQISNSVSTCQTQRMTHIAVERNRRKQMNDHLSALKALMPSDFVQKTDQASIIGGAVEFVKELETLLESLLWKQRRRAYAEILGPSWDQFNVNPGPKCCTAAPYTKTGCAPSMLSATSTSEDPNDRFSPKRRMMSSELFALPPEHARVTNEVRAECRSAAATVEVKAFGNDAIVNISTQWRAHQLVKVIVALERLDFNILHTSVTTNKNTALYTFNAQVGPQCRMTVNQVAAALHQTFNGMSYTIHA